MRFSAIAMLAALALPAFAQSDAVLIDATRFPEDARRLPASVTVLTAEDIKQSAARTLPELLTEQVGITMKDFFGNNASSTSVDLRGFGATGTQNTLILVDGRRVTDVDLSGVQWSAIPLASVERIEILRGTGAVLYGDGATTGVINIVTRSPLQQGKRAEILGRVASYGTAEAQLYGSHATGAFGINATLYGYDSEGYRDNNRNQQQNAAANLRWAPGDSIVDLRLGTDRQDLRLPGARRVQPSIGLDEYATDRRGAQTPLDWSSRDGERAGVTYVTRVGGAELNLGADWRGKQQQSYFDQSGFPFPATTGSRAGPSRRDCACPWCWQACAIASPWAPTGPPGATIRAAPTSRRTSASPSTACKWTKTCWACTCRMRSSFRAPASSRSAGARSRCATKGRTPWTSLRPAHARSLRSSASALRQRRRKSRSSTPGKSD